MVWERVLAVKDLGQEEMRRVEVGGRGVVVGRQGERLHAFAATCPHASAELCEGTLRPAYVICPLHAYRFDLRSGRCLKPRDGPRLRLFEVEVRGEEVWVRVEE